MKKQKGFTLIEMIMTVALIIILSSISYQVYQGYIYDAKSAEGYSLLGQIRDAQRRYYNEWGNFLDDRDSDMIYCNNWTCNESVLEIDARMNRYYTSFSWDTQKYYSFWAKVSGKNAPNLIVYYNLTSGVTYQYF